LRKFAVSYAIELTASFLASFEQLDPVVQEIVLDHLDALAERADEGLFGGPNSVIGWHRHLGTVDDVPFELVTFLRIDHGRRKLIAAEIREPNTRDRP
jgi:hypothetical protein